MYGRMGRDVISDIRNNIGEGGEERLLPDIYENQQNTRSQSADHHHNDVDLVGIGDNFVNIADKNGGDDASWLVSAKHQQSDHMFVGSSNKQNWNLTKLISVVFLCCA